MESKKLNLLNNKKRNLHLLEKALIKLIWGIIIIIVLSII